MFIDDKELQVKKQANVNGTLCTLSYHNRLKMFFVCKNDTVIYIGDSDYWGPKAYNNLIDDCLNQTCTIVTIVDGSLQEAI